MMKTCLHYTLSALFTVALALTPTGPASAGLFDCGQPVTSGDAPLASDALFVLRASVQLEMCGLHICDVDGNMTITAGDALRVLRISVGNDEPLDCPAATSTTTSTSTTSTSTTSTSTTTSTTTSSSTTTTMVPAPTWTQVQALFEETCAGGFCHTNGQNSGGLSDLDDFDAGYADMVNAASTCFNTTFTTRIIPFDPDNSFVMRKLEGTQDCGSRMPLTGRDLTEEEIAGVRAWIMDGAPKN